MSRASPVPDGHCGVATSRIAAASALFGGSGLPAIGPPGIDFSC
ncbi:hypothetical protein [Herbihabitans rhizosphaerae]|nr:hypothetical protein [Herbihabitans rhizosphaerae]